MLLVYVLRHVLHISQALLIRHFSHQIPPPLPSYPASMKLRFRMKTLACFRGRCDATAIVGIRIRFTLLTFYGVFVVSKTFAGN